MSVKDAGSKTDMIELARRTVELARKKGAAEAAATTTRERNVEVQWRDGKLEKISEATTRGLSMQLYVDGRYSAAASNDFRPEALEQFVADSIALTRALEPDEHRKLPEPDLYQGRQSMDLDIEDASQALVTSDQRRAFARDAYEAAKAADSKGVLLSSTTSFGDSVSELHRVASNGFEGSRRGTFFSVYAEASIKDGERRPDEYEYIATRWQSDLTSAAEVGRKATERAYSRMGAAKGKSEALPMIVDNRAAGRVLSMLMGPLNGGAIQQKRSFLEGKIDKQIGSKLFDVTDDPFVKRGMGSRHFDGEGIALKVRPIVEKGVLRTFFIDSYYARKLGQKATTGGTSNVVWTLGTQDRAGLIKAQKNAILVTGFIGGNSNGATGDFSLGVQGFRVRNGAIAEPIVEMNIAGNQAELWKQLIAVGNDPFPYSSMRTPTLVFDKVQFAGT